MTRSWAESGLRSDDWRLSRVSGMLNGERWAGIESFGGKGGNAPLLGVGNTSRG